MVHRTIYLVRHGITRSNIEKVYAGWGEEELTEEGVTKVDELGKELQGWGISYLFTSPVKRAIQTAQILNKYIHGKLVIDPDLKEMKMGTWEGLSEDEVATKYPSEYRIWGEKPAELQLDGRERLEEVQQRGMRAIKRILELHQEAVSLAVTHVAIIRCLFLYFSHLPLNSYKAVDVPNHSIHRVIFNKGRIAIERIG